MYEFKIDLFDNSEPEEFLFFVQKFKITLEDFRMLADNANLKYICTVLRGKAICLFDTLFVQVGSTTTTHLNQVLFGLGTYFFHQNSIKTKVRDAPRDEEAAQLKCDMLPCLSY